MFATKFRLKVLFLLVLLSSDCFCASQPKLDNNHVFCKRMIPGLDRLSRGIDITRLDFLAKNINSDDGFCSPVFKLTCNSHHKWYHENIPNVEYDRPDQVSHVDSLSGGELNKESHLYRRIIDVKASLKGSVDTKIGADTSVDVIDKLVDSVVGSFSSSSRLNLGLNLILAKNTSFYEIFASVSSVGIDLDEPQFLTLSKKFTHSLNELTGTYDEQPEMYDRIVQKYGTHYLSSAIFGGIAKQTININTDYLDFAGEIELNQNIQATLLSIFHIKGSLNISANGSYKRFEQNSASKFEYFGGFTDMPSTNGNDANNQFFTKWVPTVNRLPRILNGNLFPIENLVPNTTTREQMNKATTVHRIRAYFQELNTTLTLSGFKFNDQQLGKFRNVKNLIALKQFNNTNEMANDIQDLLMAIHETNRISSDSKSFNAKDFNSIFKARLAANPFSQGKARQGKVATGTGPYTGGTVRRYGRR